LFQAGIVRWTLGLAIAALLIVAPFVYYRAVYAHGKRLREVVPGCVYRSGQMTADGFAEAVARYGIHTIINLQDEYPDPDVRLTFLDGRTIKETELCKQLHVRYVFLPPDLIQRRQVPAHRPRAIDRFLDLLDKPSTYPVLIHCKAGLHRTGVMTAVYRMEYQNWTPLQAHRELKANGFGEFVSTSANDYITQYILTYRRGIRARGQKSGSGVRGHRPTAKGYSQLTPDP
jgi:protein tyrosine/serine phosphatase